MESLVTIQQELAALKKEVIELRGISNLQREKRRAKRARQKERKNQKEDPHSEEGQDQAEGTHITADGAGVVMSEENRPAHDWDKEVDWDKEAAELDAEYAANSMPCGCYRDGCLCGSFQDSSSGTSGDNTASDACSGDTGDSQEEEAAAAAAELLEAELHDEEEEGDSQIGEMLQQLVKEWNQYKKGNQKGKGKGKGKGKSKGTEKGKNKGRGSGGRRQAASMGSGA